MKISRKQLLKEEYEGKTLVIVDVQPAYSDFLSFDISDLCEWLNEKSEEFHKIIFLFNGEDLGLDSWSDISLWYNENGLDETIVQVEEFEKNYGFFRDLMDNGVDFDDIIKLGKYMFSNNIGDVNDVPLEFFNTTGFEEDVIVTLMGGGYSFYIPDAIDLLEKVDNLVLIGGGVDECLAEVEILCDILDKTYILDNDWTY